MSWAQKEDAAGRQGFYEKIKFPVPSLKTGIGYLGLKKGEYAFSLSDINASTLIIEVFNTYCHYCMRSMRRMNDLYELILEKGLSEEIKIVGIGMPNSESEISKFQRQFDVLFPLISDPNSQFYRIVGRVKLPCLMVVQRGEDGYYREVFRKERENRPAERILTDILHKTGIKQ